MSTDKLAPPFLAKIISTEGFVEESSLEVGDIVMIDRIKEFEWPRDEFHLWWNPSDGVTGEWGREGIHYEIIECEVESTPTVRDMLFRDMDGCTNHDCIIKKRVGIGTNGSCSCMINFSRAQLHILKSRLSTIIDKEIKDA